jgi:hypothetical protein
MLADARRSTGDPRVDAAFAAMAECLARSDGWTVPLWARLPEREAWPRWFVTDLRGLHPRTGLRREDIRALLDDLSAELAARSARAEFFLVGGAALAVAHDATRSIRDLGAVFIPADAVRQAAAAEREGLGALANRGRNSVLASARSLGRRASSWVKVRPARSVIAAIPAGPGARSR